MTVALAGTEDHPQARMVLSTALASGQPSHAYLFHGPAGTGKRTVARAFAAELLAEGSDDPGAVRTRVMHGAHPDLTWVRPSGAHVMRVDDVDANRLLKTLEEPAAYVHLILMTDALGRVLETVISRCQLVRFEPLPAATIAAHLVAEGIPAERAEACARLALGNEARARYLASAEGEELRADVERLGRAALAGGAPPEG